MTKCRGVVKNNMVFLEPGTQLPEGAEVEVCLLEQAPTREEVFARVLANQIRHPVGMEELLEEDKKEREERMDQWFQ